MFPQPNQVVLWPQPTKKQQKSEKKQKIIQEQFDNMFQTLLKVTYLTYSTITNFLSFRCCFVC